MYGVFLLVCSVIFMCLLIRFVDVGAGTIIWTMLCTVTLVLTGLRLRTPTFFQLDICTSTLPDLQHTARKITPDANQKAYNCTATKRQMRHKPDVVVAVWAESGQRSTAFEICWMTNNRNSMSNINGERQNYFYTTDAQQHGLFYKARTFSQLQCYTQEQLILIQCQQVITSWSI